MGPCSFPCPRPSRFLGLGCLCPAMGFRLLWDLLFVFPVHPLLLLFLVPCVTMLCRWFIVCLWGTSHCFKHAMGTFYPHVTLVRQLLLPPAFCPGEAWDREVEHPGAVPLGQAGWGNQSQLAPVVHLLHLFLFLLCARPHFAGTRDLPVD